MRGIFKVSILLVVFAVFAVSVPARAVDLNHSFVVGADVGLDLDPDLLAAALMAEYHVTPNVAVGPYLTLGVDQDILLFGTSGIAKYKANLNETDKLKPYGMVGIGFLVWNYKYEGKWQSGDTKFYFPVGGGFEYWISEKFAWGGNILFNISDEVFFSLFFGVRTKF